MSSLHAHPSRGLAGERGGPTISFGFVVGVVLVASAEFAGIHMASSAFNSASAFAFYALAAAFVSCSLVSKPMSIISQLKERDYIRIALGGVLLSSATFVFLYTLKIVGSMRAVMLSYSDIAIVAAVSAYAAGKSIPKRALLVFALGWLLLVWYSPPAIAVDTVTVPSNAGNVVLEGSRRLLQFDEPPVNPRPDALNPDLLPDPGVIDLNSKLPQVNKFARRGAAAFAAAKRVKNVLDAHTQGSVFLAGILLLVAAYLMATQRGLTHKIAHDSKIAARKVHALVLGVAVPCSFPLAILNHVFSPPVPPSAEVLQPSMLRFVFVACLFGVFVLHLPEAVFGWRIAAGGDGRNTKFLDNNVLRSVLMVISGVIALLWCGLSSSPNVAAQFTISALFGFLVLYVPAQLNASNIDVFQLLSATLKQTDSRTDAKGQGGVLVSALLGLRAVFRQVQDAVWPSSSSALPTHVENIVRPREEASLRQAELSFFKLTSKVMSNVLADKNSRKIFMFLCINFSFMFVEIIVGWITNSLGLISDAGHMFFDNASLFIGLYAAYMAKWKADDVYTFGYARYEVLAGFVNAIFLIFVAVSVVFEALERLWEPPEIHGEHVLPVSVLGLLVNIIGLVFFHDAAHAHGGHGHSHGGGHGHSHGAAPKTENHGHSHGGKECHGHGHGTQDDEGSSASKAEATNENMHGVFLHVLADALGSVGVIISSLLIKYFGWFMADPVMSLIISILILLSVFPLIRVTVDPLLSRLPSHLDKACAEALQSINKLPGVISVDQPHFWKHHADIMVATAHIIVQEDADDQKVLQQAKRIITNVGFNVVTLQVVKESTLQSASITAAQPQEA